MPRNPNWTRDELILALDLYCRVNPLHTDEKHPDIVALSQLLNRLPIHPRVDKQEEFRNPNGVYMKLCNFLRLDPDYHGKGLESGSKLEELVWQEFASDRDRLAQTAQAIRNSYLSLAVPTNEQEADELVGEDEEFPEGRVLTRVHRQRERNASLVAKKKARVLQSTGKLACEVCAFDFAQFYGDLGNGFAECHHNRPLSELRSVEGTKLADLSIVCANCHRVLHRVRPWLTIEQLKNRLGFAASR